MKVYFVTTGLREELEVIKKVRPPRLLCSFWYFKNKPLAELCEELGYHPEIILDSGAYSAYTKGKNVNLLDYLAYIRENEEHIKHYISLDVIGDEITTRHIYSLMRRLGFNPIPVIHYGEETSLVWYAGYRARTIALGATAGIKNKKVVANWCSWMKMLCPSVNLHLLGSSSSVVLRSGALASCDSSAWYVRAVNGLPRDIPGKDREAKKARAEANMRRIMEEFDEVSVPAADHSHQPGDGKN